MKKIILISILFILNNMLLKGQQYNTYGVYWDFTDSVEYLASIDVDSGIITTIDSIPGVTSWGLGSSTFDYVNGNYIFNTNLGITVVNAQNANIVNTFPSISNLSGLEYDCVTKKVYGVYWDFTDSVEYLASIDVDSGIITTIDSIPGVMNWSLGSSTFDYLNGNYIFNTNLGITVVNAQNANIVNTFPGISNLSGLEFYNFCDSISCQAAISGQITDSAGLIMSGIVNLRAYNSNPTQMIVVASTTIDSLGYYIFTNVPLGQFLVIAKGDSISYPNYVPTYHDSTNHWQKATIIDVSTCDTIIIANIKLIQFPTTIGFGKISGQITQGGFNKTSADVGDPLSDIDIMLEQIPDSNVVGYTITDSLGYYSFKNIPQGNYVLYVDIAGLPMDSTYFISITSTDTVFINLDLYVDSTSIGIATLTSIKDNLKINENILNIYPNPFSNSTLIEFENRKNQIHTLTLYNSIGQVVRQIDNINEGQVKIEKKNLTSGFYFFQLRNDVEIVGTGKIIIE